MADDVKATRDLADGTPFDAFDATGMVAGRFGDEEIVLVRTAGGIHAVSALCTHKGAPLARGLLVGGTIRCPWHHACFAVASGEATAAPAFRPLKRWATESRDGRVFIGAPLGTDRPSSADGDERIIIVGTGAAGAAAADALVRLGHADRVTLIGDEGERPYDKTMLTKEFLSGAADAKDLPIEIEDLAARGVDLRLDTTVTAIAPESHEVHLSDGTALPFTKLILATGAEPRRLDAPGADLPHVRLLRSAADARRLIGALGEATRVVVVGASFIGLEAAAALRDREIDVTVVAPEAQPLAQVLGTALSEAILAIHRRRGTALHLGRKVARIEKDTVILDDGTPLPAGIVLIGIGVTPRTALAEAAGLTVENGIVVDERLRTSHRDIFAVGDITRWPDPISGERIRVEHWAVAQRQGQIAAANAVGRNLRYDVVPFFWTLHFDLSVRYVGHAAPTDHAEIDGDPAAGQATVRFYRGDRITAVATMERDLVSLQAETDFERRLGAPAATLPVG